MMRNIQFREVQRMKRENYLSWNQYFMGIALLSAERSKDPNTQVGACIVDADNKILSVGYNGMPSGCKDDEMPWGRVGKPLENKYFFVCHAELNAIRKASKKLGDWRLEGCTMYVTLEPCQMCSGALVQSRIDEVVIGCMNAKAGCAGSVMNLLQVDGFNHQVKIIQGVLEEECSSMLSEFFRKLREKKKQEKAALKAAQENPEGEPEQ